MSHLIKNMMFANSDIFKTRHEKTRFILSRQDSYNISSNERLNRL